uniref:Uncharacterized protein n=1 Tax=Phlebotomus papatasi TaxID=29031 RepID=A0A1B0EVI2_PHLPP
MNWQPHILQIDLAHNLLSSNGKTSNVPYRESPPPSVANTWIPVNQALSLRSCQLQQQQIDVRVPPPIVCTRESKFTSVPASSGFKWHQCIEILTSVPFKWLRCIASGVIWPLTR